MKKLRSIIVDDELHARENLSMLLKEFCPEIEIVELCDGVEAAQEALYKHHPDLVFLDIRMPSGIEGLELLESIEQTNFQVIFVTAFKEHAIRAFNANAIHYLLKPIDIEELKEAVAKAVEFDEMISTNVEARESYQDALKNVKPSILSGDSGRITVAHAKGIKIVKHDEIAYLEGSGNCTWIRFTDGSSFLDTRTMKVYEDMLPASHFYRIHKSYLINLTYLKEYLHDQGHYVVLENGTSLPVARSRVSDFVEVVKSIK